MLTYSYHPNLFRCRRLTTKHALLQQIVLQHSDVVINSGFSKPLASVKLSDKTEISRAVSLQYTLLQCLAEVDQLKKGLSSLGLLDILQSNPDILAPFFSRVLNDQRLTAGDYILCYVGGRLIIILLIR